MIQNSVRTNWLVVALCFLPVFMDGFDTSALALAIPALAGDWGLVPAAFTLPLVATSVGVVVGYIASGWAARGIGRRRLLIGSSVLFSAGTLVTAMVLPTHSVEAVTLVRLVTGLGFGGAYPSGVAFATDFSSKRQRQVVPLLVTLGFAAGATVAGVASQQLITMFGTEGLFWSAGVVSGATALLLVAFLPAERAPVVGEGRRTERVAQLFERAVRLDTLLLWTFAFLAFLVSTALTSWVPVLLGQLGFGAAEAPLGLAFVYLGAIAGGVAVIPLAARLGIGRTLVVLPLLGALCLVAMAGGSAGGVALLILLAGAGAGISGSQSGQLGMAVSLYPPEHRTTGIGWASALGKAGSIAGPSVAGIMLGTGSSAGTIFAVAAAGLAVAIGCAVLLWVRTRGRTAAR
ncbi:MFS transporter [Pseudonocardia acaciae]|uniref:MFS transporter n=1 Tax=Pseudonocardia acaciae TaxID=551276 RepID=UPI00056C9CCD|nr:MFS transporter [Pseudonocardia acaciae]